MRLRPLGLRPHIFKAPTLCLGAPTPRTPILQKYLERKCEMYLHKCLQQDLWYPAKSSKSPYDDINASWFPMVSQDQVLQVSLDEFNSSSKVCSIIYSSFAPGLPNNSLQVPSASRIFKCSASGMSIPASRTVLKELLMPSLSKYAPRLTVQDLSHS